MVSSAINKILGERPGFKLLILAIWILAALYLLNPIVQSNKYITLQKILKSGQVTVITRNTAHCYYLYRGQPMGFEYELAKAFADYLGVKLKIRISNTWEAMIPALGDGSGAFIAASMTVTPKRRKRVAFSDGYMQIRQHIITNRNNVNINRVEDLAGKTVDIRKGTSYQERLEELQRQGINLSIALHTDVPTEELIRQVADGEIDITIADSNIALLNRRYNPGAIIAGPISPRQNLAWAVNRKSLRLLERINSFFKAIKKDGRYEQIYNKYYGNVEDFDYVDLRTFHRRLATRLPRYSPFIKAAAKKNGFDWRLIAAQMYQESHLNPWAKSQAGARGLMQLLPSTARSLGVKDIYNPVENIYGGVRHLKNLYDRFDGAAGKNRLLISLAAYNIGAGHVDDARSIAVKMRLDPNRWDSLAKTLPLLRFRKYYKNLKFGYCRGTEPLRYIKQIMIYYDILKRREIQLSARSASS